MPNASLARQIGRASAVLFPLAWAGVVGGELGRAQGEPMIWDKALHLGAYFILAALVSLSLKNANRLLALFALVVMGAVLEVVQGLIGRDASLYDELANTLGVVAGGIAGWLVISLVRLRRAD